MNCDFSNLKQETIHCKGVNLENFFFSLVSDGLPGYLLYPTVLSSLHTGYLLLVALWRLHIYLV